jgi:4-hydroxy 2-oxovalerate aldolase
VNGLFGLSGRHDLEILEMPPKKKEQETKGSWVTYRPDIKVLDCTVRDGGLINSHNFDDRFVKAVYDTCVAAGVDYMEIGYKGAKRLYSPTEHGLWKHCDEDDMRRIVGDNPTSLKLCAMADADRCDYHEDILPKEKSVLDCIRVACYINQIPMAVDMIKDATDKGYETTVNIMAISTVHEKDLMEALEVLAGSSVGTVYLVDSFGTFYSEEIRDLAKKYLKILSPAGKTLGIHAHNNQQLAYANTIESLITGASMLDATINGMGRGAGNCPLELLIGFLHNPKFKLRPILECIQNVFFPMRDHMEWGYQLAYMVTGQLNQHPRYAIKVREGDNPDDILGFYDQMTLD